MKYGLAFELTTDELRDLLDLSPNVDIDIYKNQFNDKLIIKLRSFTEQETSFLGFMYDLKEIPEGQCYPIEKIEYPTIQG